MIQTHECMSDTVLISVVINKWISDHPRAKIIDIKYSAFYDVKDDNKCSGALIIYEE